MKTLLPLATPKGRTGLNLLITEQSKASAALQHASSQASYSKAAAAFVTPAVKRDNAILTRALATCPKT